jgi:hypothetical protein
VGPSGETAYSYDLARPDVLVQGRQSVAKLTVRLNGAIVALNNTTACKLYDLGGTLLATATVAIASGSAYATFSAAMLPSTLAIGSGYQLVWSPVLDSGTGISLPDVDRQCFLALRPFYVTVSVVDLLAIDASLLTRMASKGFTTLQTWIDAAAVEACRKMSMLGLWPHQVKSQWSCHNPILFDAYSRVCWQMFQWSHEAVYQTSATHYARKAESAWAEMKTTLDRDDDGLPDDDESLEGLRQVLHVNPAPRSYRLSSRW